ncbi:MAG: VanZ family protein [Clostridia bacterium]|nr:VanZ family protein [Clostridia bacterium]
MDIINVVSRYIYGFSIVEFAVFILLSTWVYLKAKEYISNKSTKFWNIINIVLIMAYTIVVLYKVLLSRKVGSVTANLDLIPLSSYVEYFMGKNSEAFFTNRANVLLFFPFGLFFFDFLKTKKHVIICVSIALIFSFFLELIQYIFSLGIAEADDVIHNTLGAFLGYLASAYVPRIQITIKNKT